MPRPLGVLLGLAGAGYLIDTFSFFLIPGYDGSASPIVLAPALVAEFWFALWLLTKGRRLEHLTARATPPHSSMPATAPTAWSEPRHDHAHRSHAAPKRTSTSTREQHHESHHQRPLRIPRRPPLPRHRPTADRVRQRAGRSPRGRRQPGRRPRDARLALPRPPHGIRRPLTPSMRYSGPTSPEPWSPSTITRNGIDIGDEIVGFGTGAFAEFAIVPASMTVHRPDSINVEQAAAIPTTSVAALQAIRDAARVEAGQHVAVIGASGGVGTFAVQIAKAYGAEVTGVAGARNLDLVRSIGADHVVDYTVDDIATHTGRYDVIIDLVGNQPIRSLRHALTPTGTFVVVGGQNPRSVTGMQRFVAAAAMSPFTRQRLVPLFSKPRQGRPRHGDRTRTDRDRAPDRRPHIRSQRHSRSHSPYRNRTRHRQNRRHDLNKTTQKGALSREHRKPAPAQPARPRRHHQRLDRPWTRPNHRRRTAPRSLQQLSAPRDAEANSFTLHAPLELMARAQLLPMVSQHAASTGPSTPTRTPRLSSPGTRTTLRDR